MDNDGQLVIETARECDISSVVRLIQLGRPDGKARTSSYDHLAEGALVAFRQIQKSPEHMLVVGKISNKVVACLEVLFAYHIMGSGKPDCYLESFHVDPDYRDQGYGSELMTWAIRRAKVKNCRRIQLTTDKLRKRAHNFYLRFGFEFSHFGAKLYLDE